MFKLLTLQKSILTISVLVIAFCDLRAQRDVSTKSVSDSIELVKTLIRKNGSVTSYATGISGTHSNQFQRFIYLLNYLSTDEFLDLTNDTSTCLRIYAYAGLKYKSFKRFDLINSKFQTDNTQIPYMAGCLGGNLKASAIISNFKQWYSKETVTFALKQQNEDKYLWYTNFVFRN